MSLHAGAPPQLGHDCLLLTTRFLLLSLTHITTQLWLVSIGNPIPLSLLSECNDPLQNSNKSYFAFIFISNLETAQGHLEVVIKCLTSLFESDFN